MATEAKANAVRVPASPPVRVDIRIGGRLQFSHDVYSPDLKVGKDSVVLTADLEPTMIDKPTPAVLTRFADQSDPRDQEEIILQVHSGRRDIAAPTPKENG